VVLTADLLLESISQSNVSVGGADTDLTLRTSSSRSLISINGVGPKSGLQVFADFHSRNSTGSIFEVHFCRFRMLRSAVQEVKGHTNTHTQVQVIMLPGFALQDWANDDE
jgi:hypothetical protein